MLSSYIQKNEIVNININVNINYLIECECEYVNMNMNMKAIHVFISTDVERMI